ncbi:LysR family transcriptional regulator [Enterobacteriaceae bacterium BIT-l23]|uniref:LysR substrate-binding domain-containing protein n=1 Tax=Jejubacter sp. L23 TaxID=3092086 RepID=UPI00158579AA|nr:LysR family transcriptional regulator [Enterobacteriaceae bacterium BIT-l23]
MTRRDNNNNLPLPSLRNIQAFIEVANAGSINLAAEILNITASAVSHQIAALESFIGKKLFVRSGKGVILTSIGQQYLKDVSGALSIIGRATDQAINDIHHEHLRIHSAPSFGLLWLMIRLDKFRQRHPELQLSLSCSYENLQFARDNIDIDIRHGFSEWPTLSVRTVKHERVMVLAAPEYLASHAIHEPASLLDCDLIHSNSTLINWNHWFAFHDVENHGKNFIFSFDRSYMSLEAARMGMGVILESSLLAADYIRRGLLVPVFDGAFSMPLNAHHFVFPHGADKKEKVALFLAWIGTELQNEGFEV